MNPKTLKKRTEEIERIERLAKQVEDSFQPDPWEPRVNAYVCQTCGHVEVTVDTAEGSTPMAIPCLRPPEGEDSAILGPDGRPVSSKIRCNGHMASSWYCVKPEDYEFMQIKYEWRAARADFYLRLRRTNPPLADHIRKGGLLLCKRDKASPVLLHNGEFLAPDGHILTDDEVGAHRTDMEKLRALAALHTANVERKKKADAKGNQTRAKNRAERKRKNKSRR